MEKKWLTVKEAAAYLRCSTKKVYQLCETTRLKKQTGIKFPASFKMGKWLIDSTKIDQWLI